MTIAFLNKLVEPEKSLQPVLLSVLGLNLMNTRFIMDYFGFKSNIKIMEIEEATLKNLEELIQKLYYIDE